MMTDRVKKLREKSVNTQPRIDMERAVSVTKAYKEHFGTVSNPVMRALAFKRIMAEKTIYIGDGELIVGERGAEPGATATFPELCCHTVEDLEVMDARENVNFTVTEEDKKIQREFIIPYWEKRSTRYKMFQELDKEWQDAYAAGIFTEFMEQRGPGHTVGDKKLYQKGMLDFKADIKEAIENLDFYNDPKALDKRENLRAMDIACDAMILQGKRYAEKARELAETETDENRKKELLEIAEICEHVPANAPRNFREALQMYWFVHLGVVTELNPWDSFNPGRLDQHMYPFYKKEVEEGTLTKDQAEELLQCLWVKFNNNPAPPKVGITLKESATYFDFCTINSGGLTTDGKDGVNEISYLVLDVIREMRMLQPGSNVQISEKTPQDFLKKAIDITRTGYGQPSIFNADAVVKELLNTGKSIEDARDGGTSGCVEVGAFGKEAYILTGYFNLAKILELTLNNGYDAYTGKQLGLKTGMATDYKSYEELYEAFNKQLTHFINIKIKGNNIIGRIFEKYMQAPFLSVIIDDCIKKGMDYNEGGARYNTTFIQGVGIANLTDALSSIKYNVFDNKNFTMEELFKAMEDNYKGHDRIFDLVFNKTPKYGNDDEYADAILKDVFNAFLNNVNGRPAARGGQHLIEMLPTTCHVYFGQVMKADAAGRLAEKPLADGISPAKGADRNGPTGVIKSASKMDQLKTGGALLNQKFTPAVVEGEKGLDAMAAVVRAYFKLDGHHIQFNVVGRDTLLDAQKHPDQYKNLIVRVAGYSDYFNNLDEALQNEIIERTEQQA
ncbi:MAG: glycyl radical protein [Tissierellia bacterium]|nr:glycyl radical protein [Tissierellia bacterium]